MLTFSYKGRAYKRVPELVCSDNATACTGCVFDNEHETERSPGCAAVKEALHGEWCVSIIWIPDTPEGLADYVALKLEQS